MAGIQIEHRGDAAVIQPHGSLIGGDTTESLENAVETVLREPPKRLVFDFSRVDHINSIGMATVIRTHAACRKQGVAFYVVGAPERIRDVFDVTRISTLGILKRTLEDALAG
jgi:anti-anti-sigma factor